MHRTTFASGMMLSPVAMRRFSLATSADRKLDSMARKSAVPNSLDPGRKLLCAQRRLMRSRTPRPVNNGRVPRVLRVAIVVARVPERHGEDEVGQHVDDKVLVGGHLGSGGEVWRDSVHGGEQGADLLLVARAGCFDNGADVVQDNGVVAREPSSVAKVLIEL
ncbi:hypothetical protein M427DRAFT_179633 [Gonapodya prolifera JEL478]|uniref:Uncharacterized protein n=1 Tax=Gonapodya prolifera (strain JEL478) TaxID=1344416 RepID=A0A139AQ97_GONPJ|nr:hypothetical protein M427DRAFT_179633 [Gonapodya prolifera JEL478]|eukprot:KXS18920.1 hypothetical protein M427DRAFT_179633 [Gonapodya prolifera JEL478]